MAAFIDSMRIGRRRSWRGVGTICTIIVDRRRTMGYLEILCLVEHEEQSD